MKKVFGKLGALLLAGILGAGLVACAARQQAAERDTPEQAQTVKEQLRSRPDQAGMGTARQPIAAPTLP